MARNPKVEAKEREFQIASKRTRETYDKLNGVAGRGGLEAGYLRIKEQYEERNNGSYRDPKRIAEEYFRIKAAYDAAAEEYQTAQNEKNRLRKELSELTKSADAEKSVQDTREELNKARAERERAIALSPSRGDAAVKAADERIASLEKELGQYKQTATGETPAVEEGGFYDDYAFSSRGLVQGPKGAEGVFVDEIKDGTAQPKFYVDLDEARLQFLKGYATTDKLRELQNKLIASNYIKQSDIAKGTWYKGLDDLLIARSVKLVSDAKYGLGTEISVEEYLNTKKESGTGGPKIYRDLSTRGDARQQIDEYLMDLTGERATEEEYEEYYKILNAEEKRQTRTIANGTSTGDVMTDAERMVIAAKVARNRLKNTDVDALLSSSKGSRVSLDIAALQELAADYGIDMTAADALKQVTLGIGQKDYLQKQQERLRLIAKKMHPGLVDHLDAGGTVAEVANVYARTKFTKLGVVVKTATKDKDVMDAVSSGKSITQFEKELQGNPMWRFTDEARETAAGFLETIGRMWGRG
jgi:hypothetical protein